MLPDDQLPDDPDLLFDAEEQHSPRSWKFLIHASLRAGIGNASAYYLIKDRWVECKTGVGSHD